MTDKQKEKSTEKPPSHGVLDEKDMMIRDLYRCIVFGRPDIRVLDRAKAYLDERDIRIPLVYKSL